MASIISPYKISVRDDSIKLLKQKLASTQLPSELDDAGWDYGSPLADVRKLVDYWQQSFDWKKAEADLNKLPQYTTELQCDGFERLRIHFVHQQSENKGAVPLLFVHGWPGSFIEVSKILPGLVGGGSDKPAFHVVALSLPGYGFSAATKKRGFGIKQMAETAHKLMLQLGYNEYGIKKFLSTIPVAG